MHGSINFDGSLVGNITGGGGGGDEVIITPVVTSGTKIADVSVGGVKKDLYTPDYGADIVALDGRLDIAEDNIASLTGRVGTAEGNITNLAGHMTEAETDITEIKQSLSQLDGLLIYKDLTPTDDYAEFNDGSNLPLISLISNIEPIQSGSGTPSPDNPRSISGHTDIDIIVSPNSDFSGGSTYSVNFVDGGNPLTVYGGTLDVCSGVLTVDRAYVDMGTLTWTYQSAQNVFSTNISGLKRGILICSNYKYTDINNVERMNDGEIWDKGNAFSPINAVVKDLRYTSASDFQTAMNGVQLVYNLATPLTIQLTPQHVNSLLGQNYISSDVGDITNVKYLGVLNLS